MKHQAMALSNRGNAYSGKERYSEAIADYTNMIRIAPDFADAYFNRSLAYRKMEKYRKARRDRAMHSKLK